MVPTRVKQIQDGRWLPSLKIENRPCLWNGLTDLREVWQNDAYCASEVDRKLKFPILKIQDVHKTGKNGKLAIEQYLLMQRPVPVKIAIHRVGKSITLYYVIYFTYFT